MKTGAVTSEFWLSAGGAAAIYEAVSKLPPEMGLHALGVGLGIGIACAGYAIARALTKKEAA